MNLCNLLLTLTLTLIRVTKVSLCVMHTVDKYSTKVVSCGHKIVSVLANLSFI